ncbi:4'-phosphopantetheinyl transferase superfamily protein [Thalassotalea sp. 1_MG-2023]|uniref:4'-phosphopantetheinyl transferase family protein n=1 Tax=Thalassotalea sp. 1_MG-2023 TaxID=3062680 RepID=UPI0026E12561|nr:4'-phosphopantetheinyl transferase superfamily protein [Thalassotalea sp. 1_MG-2023]MDO6426652.1 4'-phosphopantetheinyl transferase superfamily protein [Thalassotalea sp. 1_MG-2023]
MFNSEREQFLLKRSVKSKLTFLQSRALIKKYVGLCFNYASEDIEVVFNHQEQCLHALFNSNLVCRVSLSHSGKAISVAFQLSEKPFIFGVDIENKTKKRDLESLAKTCLSVKEQENFRLNLNDSVAFYRQWTLKEALMKATGQPLSTLFSLDSDKILLAQSLTSISFDLHEYVGTFVCTKQASYKFIEIN